jgi:hypothetical protein
MAGSDVASARVLAMSLGFTEGVCIDKRDARHGGDARFRSAMGDDRVASAGDAAEAKARVFGVFGQMASPVLGLFDVFGGALVEAAALAWGKPVLDLAVGGESRRHAHAASHGRQPVLGERHECPH